MCVLCAQSCLALCDHMDYSPPWDFPGKNTRVGCYFLLQGIFPTQGLNPYLLHPMHWQAGSLTTESPRKHHFILFYFILFIYIFFLICWRLMTSQHFRGFCHTLTRISHGVTCSPHPDPPSHLPLHPIPLGLSSAPGPSTCLMHPTWAGDLFHYR